MKVTKSFYDWCIDNNRQDLLERWNGDRNKLSPKEVSFQSNKKFYFDCDANGEHRPELVRLAHVVETGSSIKCKVCNSFAQWCLTNMPNDFISKYWDEGRNHGIDPWEIGRSSHKSICLKCHNRLDHSYFTSPHSFTNGTYECPVCNGQTVFKGFNDLFTTDSYAANIWDFNKNTLIDPYTISRGSGKKVWWKCDVCGHEWLALVSNITKGKGCPECGKTKRYQTFLTNKLTHGCSFGDQHPELLKFWDYENNVDITPFDILPNYMKEVWWKCENGHRIYKSPNAMLSSLLHGHSGCKYCAGLVVLHGFNDIATTHPELLVEWDYDSNIDISPENISFGSTEMIWWRCQTCGYRWKASPNSRTNRESGCPECARHMTTSKLQIKVESYIKNKYELDVLHERDCTIIAVNPQTGYLLPYDNDVNINGTRLIIEVHGEQHYHITEFTRTNAIKRGVDPQEELEYQQYKDRIKKDYAISNGYEYLEIPYYAAVNQQYQTLLDDKIQDIINNTKLIGI